MSTFTWILSDASGAMIRTDVYDDGELLVDTGNGLERPWWLDEPEEHRGGVSIAPEPGGRVAFEVNPWLLHEINRRFAYVNKLTLTTDYEPKDEDRPASVIKLLMDRYGTADPDEIQKVIADPNFEPTISKDGSLIQY